MNREVILVEVINKADMSTEKSRGFTDTEKAEKYFVDLLKEYVTNIDEDDIEDALDNGYHDFSYDEIDERSITIKEILLEDD